MVLDKTLTWFSYVWIAALLILNILIVIGLMIGAPNMWAGIWQILDLFSPLNINHYIAEIVLASPAIGALIWPEHRRKKVLTSRQAGSNRIDEI